MYWVRNCSMPADRHAGVRTDGRKGGRAGEQTDRNVEAKSQFSQFCRIRRKAYNLHNMKHALY